MTAIPPCNLPKTSSEPVRSVVFNIYPDSQDSPVGERHVLLSDSVFSLVLPDQELKNVCKAPGPTGGYVLSEAQLQKVKKNLIADYQRPPSGVSVPVTTVATKGLDALVGARLDFKRGVALLPPNDIREPQSLGMSIEDILGRIHSSSDKVDSGQELTALYWLSLNDPPEINLQNPNQARLLFGLLSNLSQYRLAAQILDYHDTLSPEGSASVTPKPWADFAREMARRQEDKQPLVERVEFYGSNGTIYYPISLFIGDALSIGLSHREGEELQTSKKVIAYLTDVLPFMDSRFGVDDLQKIQDPRIREKAALLLRAFQARIDAPYIPPQEMRLLLDPDSLTDETIRAIRKPEVLGQILEAKKIAEVRLGITKESVDQHYEIHFGTLPGEKSNGRSHAFPSSNIFFIDMESPIQPETLVHEWSHLLTDKLCALSGHYTYLAEGIAAWADKRLGSSEITSNDLVEIPGFAFLGALAQKRKRDTYLPKYVFPRAQTDTDRKAEEQGYRRGFQIWKLIEEKHGPETVRAIIRDIEFGPDPLSARTVQEIFKKHTGRSSLELMDESDQQHALSRNNLSYFYSPYHHQLNYGVDLLTNPYLPLVHSAQLQVDWNLNPEGSNPILQNTVNGDYYEVTLSLGVRSELPEAFSIGDKENGHLNFLDGTAVGGGLEFNAVRAVKERPLLSPYGDIQVDPFSFGGPFTLGEYRLFSRVVGRLDLEGARIYIGGGAEFAF